MFTLKRLILVLQLRITTLLRTPRAMKGEVDQLHKKISLGLRLGFSELSPRLTHGVLVWWGNLWLESAISNEASFRTSGVAFWGWSPIVSALYKPIY